MSHRWREVPPLVEVEAPRGADRWWRGPNEIHNHANDNFSGKQYGQNNSKDDMDQVEFKLKDLVPEGILWEASNSSMLAYSPCLRFVQLLMLMLLFAIWCWFQRVYAIFAFVLCFILNKRLAYKFFPS